MKQIQNIILRIIATFAASGLGVIGAGTLAGLMISTGRSKDSSIAETAATTETESE